MNIKNYFITVMEMQQCTYYYGLTTYNCKMREKITNLTHCETIH